MRMKATIEVEFEAKEGTQEPKRLLEIALQRGLSELKDGIEYGKRVAPTGIKRDSVRAEVKSIELV